MPAAVLERTSKTSPERGELTLLARKSLEQHPHFRGRTSVLCIEQQGRMLCLTGRLPTFYLKQLVQETVRHIPGVLGVRNDITVVGPAGDAYARPMF